MNKNRFSCWLHYVLPLLLLSFKTIVQGSGPPVLALSIATQSLVLSGGTMTVRVLGGKPGQKVQLSASSSLDDTICLRLTEQPPQVLCRVLVRPESIGESLVGENSIAVFTFQVPSSEEIGHTFLQASIEQPPNSTVISELKAVTVDSGKPENCELPLDIKSGVTYYVAMNEPNASNEKCDGLSPVYRGPGKCPFKDFSSNRVRKILYEPDFETNRGPVTLKVRKGKYTITPMRPFGPGEMFIGLLINGNGTLPTSRVILTNYQKEEVILDGTCTRGPKGLYPPECQSPMDKVDPEGKIWHLIQTIGTRVKIHGLTFDHVHKWNILAGSSHTEITCNKFIGPYGADSDSIKIGSDDGALLIKSNIFQNNFEQAIDGTRARDTLIAHNEVSGGKKGFGFKFEARNVMIRENYFHDLKDEAISFGGGTSAHPGSYEAFNISATLNRIERVGAAAKFTHCSSCSFTKNSVSNSGIGGYIRNENSIGCRSGLGCLPSQNLVFTGNRFRAMGNRNDFPSDAFVVIEPLAVTTLSLDRNLYCVSGPSGQAQFGYINKLMNLSEWQTWARLDFNTRIDEKSSTGCLGSW